MERKTFGTLLSALRKANGMTQKDLAERLNVSDKAVSRWERDENYPDLPLLPVIAEIFGVTTDELLRGERNNPETGEPNTVTAPDRSAKQVQRLVDSVNTRFLIGCVIAVIAFLATILMRACTHFAYKPASGYEPYRTNEGAHILYSLTQGLTWCTWIVTIGFVILYYISSRNKLDETIITDYEATFADGRKRLQEKLRYTLAPLVAGIGLLLMDLELNGDSDQQFVGLLVFAVLLVVFHLIWKAASVVFSRAFDLRGRLERSRNKPFWNSWLRRCVLIEGIILLIWIGIFIIGERTDGLAFAPGKVFFKVDSFIEYMEQASTSESHDDFDFTIRVGRTFRKFHLLQDHDNLGFAKYASNYDEATSINYYISNDYSWDTVVLLNDGAIRGYSIYGDIFYDKTEGISFRLNNHSVGGIHLGPFDNLLPIRVCTPFCAELGFGIWIFLLIMIPICVMPFAAWRLWRKCSKQFERWNSEAPEPAAEGMILEPTASAIDTATMNAEAMATDADMAATDFEDTSENVPAPKDEAPPESDNT